MATRSTGAPGGGADVSSTTSEAALGASDAATAPAPPAGAGVRSRVRGYLLGPGPGDEISPHVVADDVPVPPSWWARYGRLALAALSGFLGTLLIVASSPIWYLAAPSWRLTVPGIPHPGTSEQAVATFIGGLVLVGLGWIGLIGRAERAPISPRARLVAVVVVGVIWCVPVLLGPPLLSHDAYSYAAQGEMASRGIDPTANGPSTLRYGYFHRAADPYWRDAPAPYGPVAVELGKVAVEVTGHDAASAIWAMRALATAGAIMAGIGVASIARSCRQSPAVAVAVGIASPLVLLHLVGGSHNDATMMGFLTLGVAAFLRRRRVLGVVLVVLATAVKIPAGAALVFMAWNWDDDPDVPIRERIRTTALVGVGSLALLGVLTAATGISFGWLTALKSTGKVFSTFSVSTKLGFLSSDLLHAVGLNVGSDLVVALFRLAGVALAGAITLLLLLRSPRMGMTRALGVSMIAVVLLSPVVWPWYLATGFALVAASGLGRWRPTYVVLIIAASAVVFPTSVSPVKELNPYEHLLTMLVVVLIVAACYMAQRLAAWLEDLRAERQPVLATAGRSISPTRSADLELTRR